MFPLGRLLAIQEQIEVLRSEVQALVLLATNPPPPESVAEERSSTSPDMEDGNGAQAPLTEERRDESTVSDEAREVSGRQNLEADDVREDGHDGDGDSEAARLRRRRMKFLARQSDAS